MQGLNWEKQYSTKLGDKYAQKGKEFLPFIIYPIKLPSEAEFEINYHKKTRCNFHKKSADQQQLYSHRQLQNGGEFVLHNLASLAEIQLVQHPGL